MTSTVPFRPIALQISRLISIPKVLPEVMEEIRIATQEKAATKMALPDDIEEFMLHYFSLARAGYELLGAPQFERLSRFYEQLEEEYLPGGPPMSPVYDSVAMQHVLGEVPQGMADETPYTVLAQLTRAVASLRRLHELANALADSCLDLYRVTEAEGLSAQIQALRSGARTSVRLTGPFLRTGDRMLARVLPFDGRFFIADSPYLLAASEGEWLEYLERVVQAHEGTQTVRGASDARAKGKLSSKEQARRRQQQKLEASRRTPDQLIVRHLKLGSSDRFWLDYFVDGYLGERGGIVILAGVPDRPKTLPHSAEYEPPEAVR